MRIDLSKDNTAFQDLLRLHTNENIKKWLSDNYDPEFDYNEIFKYGDLSNNSLISLNLNKIKFLQNEDDKVIFRRTVIFITSLSYFATFTSLLSKNKPTSPALALLYLSWGHDEDPNSTPIELLLEYDNYHANQNNFDQNAIENWMLLGSPKHIAVWLKRDKHFTLLDPSSIHFAEQTTKTTMDWLLFFYLHACHASTNSQEKNNHVEKIKLLIGHFIHYLAQKPAIADINTSFITSCNNIFANIDFSHTNHSSSEVMKLALTRNNFAMNFNEETKTLVREVNFAIKPVVTHLIIKYKAYNPASKLCDPFFATIGFTAFDKNKLCNFFEQCCMQFQRENGVTDVQLKEEIKILLEEMIFYPCVTAIVPPTSSTKGKVLSKLFSPKPDEKKKFLHDSVKIILHSLVIIVAEVKNKEKKLNDHLIELLFEIANAAIHNYPDTTSNITEIATLAAYASSKKEVTIPISEVSEAEKVLTIMLKEIGRLLTMKSESNQNEETRILKLTTLCKEAVNRIDPPKNEAPTFI